MCPISTFVLMFALTARGGWWRTLRFLLESTLIETASFGHLGQALNADMADYKSLWLTSVAGASGLYSGIGANSGVSSNSSISSMKSTLTSGVVSEPKTRPLLLLATLRVSRAARAAACGSDGMDHSGSAFQNCGVSLNNQESYHRPTGGLTRNSSKNFCPSSSVRRSSDDRIARTMRIRSALS
ncbi:hypothetical protein RRF57_005170 [Xylaria bambusicola]|uniref:Secreted protein n=1 Tax=Xylaria bambusicola TaxID=326684 RepID=A0AAN7UBY3_9PEZI